MIIKWEGLFMKWNTNDLPIFVAICEQGGITKASHKLELPKSTVSRSLTRLEDDLGIRLFDRNTRRLRLTSEGETLLGHAKVILEQVMATNEAIAGLKNLPSGLLKVSMPMGFSRDIIGGRLAEFNQIYPDIVLQVMVSPFNINMLTEDIDVAVSVGPIENSELIAHKVIESSLIWVASTEYVQKHNWENKMSNLLSHLKFCERRYQRELFLVKKSGGKQAIDMRNLMSVNDPVMLREIVRQGGGVALMPEMYCSKDLKNNRLKRVCNDIEPLQRATIYALTNSRRLEPQKTSVFINFLTQCTTDYGNLNQCV